MTRVPHITVATSASPLQKVVLVHGGARDGYQVALALYHANLLEALVTDILWSADRPWMRRVARLLPREILATLRKRSAAALPYARVRNHYSAGLKSFLLDGVKRLPFSLRRAAIRSSDATLGRAAGKLTNRTNAVLLSYSYYAYDAFRACNSNGILFQVHPHPESVRRLLLQELQSHPECKDSLLQEWELALPEKDFERLAKEPNLAKRFLCASTFTKNTLIENGASPSAIRVVPYGIDLARFIPPTARPTPNQKLKLLFVGRINQRKGVKYLIEALQLLHSRQVELTICGRVVDDLGIFNSIEDQIIIRPSVSNEELQQAYRSSDLFVFPSVAEGFGQVLLESLASGLPILSTTHTAAPDLIRNGDEGFIVPPHRADLLAERIDWAATHRTELEAMRHRARQTATQFTWERFRSGVVDSVREFTEEFSHLLNEGPRVA